MKKQAVMFVALVAASVAIHAENAPQKNQVVVKTEAAAHVSLSSDEQAFAAKLNTESRKSFGDFSEAQRQAVIVAVQNGANADEAVQHMVSAQELKAASVAEATAAPATEATK